MSCHANDDLKNCFREMRQSNGVLRRWQSNGVLRRWQRNGVFAANGGTATQCHAHKSC